MTIPTTALPIPTDAIATVCRRHGIARLDVFGSVLRDDFDAQRSDIDLLVEFRPGQEVGFFELSAIEDELSQLFGGRKVDLVLRRSVNRWIRSRVLREAKNLYVA